MSLSFIRRTSSSGGGGNSSSTPSQQNKCPKGCRLSKSEVLITNTGIPSFDRLIGTGIPLGSIMTLREDWPRSSSNYSSSFLKCTISEGISNGQHILYVDGVEVDCKSLLSSLPTSNSRGEDEVPSTSSTVGELEDEKIKIAWRYKHLGKIDEELLHVRNPSTSHQIRTFDLGRKSTASEMAKLTGSLVTFLTIFDENFEERIYKECERLLVQAKADGTILRIILRSFASPLFPNGLAPRVLYKLKRLLVNFHETAMIIISIPSYTIDSTNPNYLADIECQSDIVIELQSFLGTLHENNRALGEYNGFLRIVKPLRNPGTLSLALPETCDLAFKIKRRQLQFEAFHLPPDLGETPSRSVDHNDKRMINSLGGCTFTEVNNKRLEF